MHFKKIDFVKQLSVMDFSLHMQGRFHGVNLFIENLQALIFDQK
jgi:hypothetical protein